MKILVPTFLKIFSLRKLLDYQITTGLPFVSEPVFKLEGHTAAVSCLTSGKFGTLLSGSWDKYDINS